jgi:hypothetical protein
MLPTPKDLPLLVDLLKLVDASRGEALTLGLVEEMVLPMVRPIFHGPKLHDLWAGRKRLDLAQACLKACAPLLLDPGPRAPTARPRHHIALSDRCVEARSRHVHEPHSLGRVLQHRPLPFDAVNDPQAGP